MSRADLKWILLGCLLPDVPWIVQRALWTVAPSVDPYAIRLYAVAQASLLCTLLLAGGLALLSARPGRVFGLLSLNAALALVLDALQTKWGSGVHLLAPIDWSASSLDLFPPESVVTYVLTALGLIVVLGLALLRPGSDVSLARGGWLRAGGAAALLVAYAGLPFVLDDDVRTSNTHYLRILGDRTERPGRYVEFDRERYLDREGADAVRIFTGEAINVRGDHLDEDRTVSVRGRFVARDTLRVAELRAHRPAVREVASYVGLALLVLVWTRWGVRRLRA